MDTIMVIERPGEITIYFHPALYAVEEEQIGALCGEAILRGVFTDTDISGLDFGRLTLRYNPLITGEERAREEADSFKEAILAAKITAEPDELKELHLPVRAYNALRHAGVYTLDDLAGMTEEELRKIRNMGKAADQVIEILRSKGISLKP